MKLTAWRVALRIARRDALRAKGRSALVVAMVALPVLGVAGADIVFRSSQLDPVEQVVRTMGRADAEIRLSGAGTTVLQAPDPRDGSSSDGPEQGKQPTAEQKRSLETLPATLVRELLPAGSTLIPVTEGPFTSTTSAEGLLQVQTGEADLADPVWRGRVTVLEGRVPAASHEIAATRDFLDRAHLKIGDRTSPRGLEQTPYTITAAVEYPGELHSAVLIGRPGELVAPLAAVPGTRQNTRSGAVEPDQHWLVKLPQGAVLDWPKVMELNKYGFTAASRSVLLDQPPRSEVPYYVELDRRGAGSGNYFDRTAVVILATVAGMALLEIVLLAGPAFAVGARRSRRQLGLLAAGGGERAHIRSVVLGGGVVLGVTGAAAGLVVAVGLVAALRPWAEQYAGERFGHFDLQPLDLLGVMGIGLVTGLLAAVVPAVQASRQDVVSALTGRGSVKPPSKRLAALGLLMLAGGAALALLGSTAGVGSRSLAVLGGSMIAELGMVALAPMLVGLFGRLGGRLPLGPRLALRDSVRHRGRTAPAVAAVMAAVAGSVAVGVYSASSDEQNRREYVASAPAGAVTLAGGWGPAGDGKLLPQLRTAVDHNLGALGPRADVQRVNYMGDCQAAMKGGCGNVDVSTPKERRCPADDLYAAPASTPEQFRELRKDPRCKQDATSFRGGAFGSLQVGDSTLLHNYFGIHEQAAEQALAAGKALVFDPKYLKDGKITLDLTEPYQDESAGPSAAPSSAAPSATQSPGATPSAGPSTSVSPSASASASASSSAAPAAGLPIAGRPTDGGGPSHRPAVHQVTVDAVLVTVPLPVTWSRAVIAPQVVQRLGLTSTDAGSVWLPEKRPGDASEQKTLAAVDRISEGVQFEVERGYRAQGDLATLALTGFAALVALGAAGIATGLAAADSQRDLTTLAAVGAAPRIRRTLSGFQCGVIAAMGAVLGTICGVVPAVALRKVEGVATPYPGMGPEEAVDRTVVVFPWMTMGITLVVLPLVAVALAALLTRSRIALLRTSG
ncbi:FtsX-like permease family protein [Kitasatospora sp. NBC_00240]|uniref:FtsX-like permease family protein n=1 Tax=Kitasatospora sp. NBC_00240 TaxID=2903567 RepID=UPI002251DC95|nr:FtsX-like permease family protein [Kitasatospora sp. NBC_00240]MCX5210920.1 FtsX-like permease family protein [Kitasatospora sp. NBC_00240]